MPQAVRTCSSPRSSCHARCGRRMRVKGVDFESLTVQVEAGYYDLINTAALRHIYNASEFPGLKYWP